jgi:DNA-binding response OmpR family regulator
VELKALLVTSDTEMRAVFTDWFRGVGIRTEVCLDVQKAVEQVSRKKFEAVVLDFDYVADESVLIETVRQSWAHRNAVTLAVASDDSAKERARIQAVRFVLARPFAPSQVTRVLRSAYAQMLEDRRRHFRVPVALNVSLRPRGKDPIQCRTINVSRDGMAVTVPSRLTIGEVLDVVFALPTPGPLVIAQAEVIWSDKHGKAGLHLDFPNSGIRERIFEWLDGELRSLLARGGRSYKPKLKIRTGEVRRLAKENSVFKALRAVGSVPVVLVPVYASVIPLSPTWATGQDW